MRVYARAVVLSVVVLALLLPGAILAQTPTPNQIDEVAKDLWCPLCNGVRLDNCELQACVQMREVIGQKLAAGEDKEQIKAYFVQQYGDVVLGQPSRQGFNLIAWIFPILAVVVGLAWVVYLVITWRRKTAPVTASVYGNPESASGTGATNDDDYMKRVERDLNQMD
jgi:cytochrome c-type biogenesis protein CcmH